MSNQQHWHYIITLALQMHTALLEQEASNIQEEKSISIENLEEALEKALGAKGKITLSPQCLHMEVALKEQMPLHKLTKALNKSISPLLAPLCNGEESNFEQAMVITYSEGTNEKDIKITHTLEQIKEVVYYDMEEGLTDEEIEGLKAYLTNCELATISYKEQFYIIDRKALMTEINLNCFACTKHYNYGCCCGSPCAMSDKTSQLLDKHLLAIEEGIKAIDEQQYETVRKHGGLLKANGDIRTIEGHCSLLVLHEDTYKCMVHKYALDQKLSIYELCSLSCLMYPLEILELWLKKGRSIYLLTAAINQEHAALFTRWGSYDSLKTELRCLDKKAHNELFKEADYRPVYQVAEGLIKHELGTSLYEGLDLLAKR